MRPHITCTDKSDLNETSANIEQINTITAETPTNNELIAKITNKK